MRLGEKKKEEPSSKNEEDITGFLSDLESQIVRKESRITGMYGDINEERCSEIVYSLLLLKDSGKNEILSDSNSEESQVEIYYDPIDFYISTYGGSAMDMFAVYDLMKSIIKDGCEINTHGIGKVMSAGVLLLAAGTKGKRKIGRNCRIMIHGVVSGQHGHLHDVENEFEEAKLTQKHYIKALSEETNMTQAYLKKLIGRKTNVYIDSKQAIELGIADDLF